MSKSSSFHHLANYRKALESLELALSTDAVEPRDYLGIVKFFEFVFELSWKSIKDYLFHEGVEVLSPRSAFQIAYQMKLIDSEEIALRMLADRNLTVHTYSQELAIEMCHRIKEDYVALFQSLPKKLEVRQRT